MNAIPTTYNGVRFRSRLEAKWAAFFDLLAWPWEYEPIDLNGYIPDFILQFVKPVLVEVKPIVKWPCRVPDCRDPHCVKDPTVDEAAQKIVRSGWKNEAILVGAGIPYAKWGGLQLGRFALEYLASDDATRSGSAAEPFICNKCNSPSFCSDEQSYHCRVSGCYDGDNHRDPDDDRFITLWREAGNRVQWRAR